MSRNILGQGQLLRLVKIGIVILGLLASLSLIKPIWTSMMLNLGYITWLSDKGVVDLDLLSEDTNAASQTRYWWHKAYNLSSPSGLRAQGWLYLMDDDVDAALVAWERGGIDVFYLLGWGKVAEANQQYPTAIRWFRLVTELDPNLRDPWFLLGQVHEQVDDWQTAEYAYREALSRPNGQPRLSEVYYSLGIMYHRSSPIRDLDIAWQWYDRAIGADDYSQIRSKHHTRLYRAQILRGRMSYDSAFYEIQHALVLNPNHYSTLVEAGRLFWLAKQDIENAEFILKQAIANNPSDARAYRVLGDIYHSVGNFDEAERMYNWAMIYE